MSRLHEVIKDYLAMRRALGYKLENHERRLLDFASFLVTAKSPFITTQHALSWASAPSISAMTAAQRLAIVRGFAEFARSLDPRNEIPPHGCLPYVKERPSPFIYSSKELQDLLEEFHALRTPFGSSTAFTFFGLISVTGMRVGEAIALDRTDFDGHEGVIAIRKSKFGKSREVPLHATTQAALRVYERERDRILPRPRSPAFFLSGNGTRLLRQNVSMTFALALQRAGLSDRRPRPRIHDLRHSFAVHTLCDWYRAGLNVETRIPLLSTYLGHVNPSSTYWYLTAIPELVGLAARRLERAMGELP